jgi:hypothetical protein
VVAAARVAAMERVRAAVGWGREVAVEARVTAAELAARVDEVAWPVATATAAVVVLAARAAAAAAALVVSWAGAGAVVRK